MKFQVKLKSMSYSLSNWDLTLAFFQQQKNGPRKINMNLIWKTKKYLLTMANVSHKGTLFMSIR